ncbi:MAG: PQQ-binding-like beta-propeller repeat protein [Candidatus Kinetoplastibacterium crithidii]|nr:MAG: PQQ-binding-like beta-propeller repeat protein [Candidatus Kinetoplastibacterium crithidii]
MISYKFVFLFKKVICFLLLFISIHNKSLAVTDADEPQITYHNSYLSYENLFSEFTIDLISKVIGDYIYVASLDGNIAKLDVVNHKCLWQRKRSIDHVVSIVADAANVVVVSEKGDILVLDSNGNQKWSSLVNNVIDTPPVIYKNILIIRTCDLSINAFYINNGEVIWSLNNYFFSVSSSIYSPMLCFNKSLITYSTNNSISSIDINTGFIEWKIPIFLGNINNHLLGINGAFLIYKDNIYFSTSKNYITCLNITNTVNVKWSKLFSSCNIMCMSDGFIYALSNEGELVKFDAIDGSVIWKKIIIKNCKFRTILAVNKLIVCGDSFGQLYFISSDDGSTFYKVKISKNSILSSVVFSNNKIIVNAVDGIYIIDI